MTKEKERIMDDRVKRNVKLADDIGNKVTSLGFNRGYMGADLSDIYIEREKYQELIDKFLTTDIKDPEAIGSILIGVRTSLQHTIYHFRSVRGPLQRLLDYCYKDDKDAQYLKAVDVYINVIKTYERNIEMFKKTPSEMEILKDDRIKRNVRLAIDIDNKVKALALRRPTQASMGANLSDIYVYLDSYKELIDKFLAMDTKDRRAIGNVLVEVQIVLKQIYEHYKTVRKAQERVIEHCYAEDDEEGQESNGS